MAKNLQMSVLAFVFISFVLNGLQRLSGLFVLELLQTTDVTRQRASAPFIFSWVVSNIIASFSSILVDKIIFKHAILFGVLLSSAGAGLCILATNITTLIVFWGLLFGAGHGLAIPHLTHHLKNRNSTNYSFILQVAPNLGVAFMPFILSSLKSCYGLHGSCLIFCGIILNYLPLALASAYNIKIFVPNIKWRVRKKSKQYSLSKKNNDKLISIESFSSSLEPDLIFKMNKKDEFKEKIRKSDFSLNAVKFPVSRKRSETRGNDLRGLEIDQTIIQEIKTDSQMVNGISKYERELKVFKKSFNDQDTIPNYTKNLNSKIDCDINGDIANTTRALEKNVLNAETEFDFYSKIKILYKIPEYENSDTINESDELTDKENLTEKETALTQTCIISESKYLQGIDSNEDNEKCEYETILSSETIQIENPQPNSASNFQIIKSLAKENSQPLSDVKNMTIKLPLDIKVHIEEYEFKIDDEDWEENFNNKYLEARQNSYRNHSCSIVLGMHKNTTLSTHNISKNSPNCSQECKSGIYSISKNPEMCDNISKEKNTITRQILFFLNRISSQIYICLLLIEIIFEINLVTLLTMFADFGNDIKATLDFKWILVAFGIGGLIGKICCCKISKTIPEKCHTIGVVLFLLIGLSTAGILYSSTLNWLASFYCILGALEGGITHLIPKFILEYIEKDGRSIMYYCMKSFLSGVAMICIPYIIGIFRDEVGDYEFLLQILSCSSVLCAFLTYFLPYLKIAPNTPA